MTLTTYKRQTRQLYHNNTTEWRQFLFQPLLPSCNDMLYNGCSASPQQALTPVVSLTPVTPMTLVTPLVSLTPVTPVTPVTPLTHVTL